MTVERLPDTQVTAREAEVLDLLGEHLTNAEIAARLYISERTVESHVSSLLRKLGAPDRRELARRPRRTTPSADRTMDLPAAVGLLADAGGFVGRSMERRSLDDAWRLAREGHTLVAFVTGGAGMGKSRLVAEMAAAAHTEGARVLLGACYEDVDDPYGPFVQALVSDTASRGEVVRRSVTDHAEALARLAPELATLFPFSRRPSIGTTTSPT